MTEDALQRCVDLNDWINASITAATLSELHLALGELVAADSRAVEAQTYADASGDSFQKLSKLATHAHVCHQLGQARAARALFAESEQLQVQFRPDHPFLFSQRGFQYCELLLSEGEAGEVIRRATQTLAVATRHRWLLGIALDHLSLGRAHLHTSSRDLAASAEHIEISVNGLRAAGQVQELPRGLLARAELYREQRQLLRAWKDLEDVGTLVRRHSLHLFEADLALECTRCHLAAEDPEAARKTLARARELVTAMDYGRRRPELAALEAQLGVDGGASGAAE